MPALKPIRVLISMLGLDQHEVGAITAARLLRDAGMEVIYLGRFNLPAAIVRAAADEDADVIGLSCHSWEYLHYLSELFELLRAGGLAIPIVVGGSVITREDEERLRAQGVAAVFGPAVPADDIPEAIRRVVREAQPAA